MKTCSLLTMATLAFAACDRPATSQPSDAMQRLAATFPRGYSVRYDVRKTDSMVNPIVGEIVFDESFSDMRYDFHWIDGKWTFQRLVCLSNGKDFTYLPGGASIMCRPAMREFLAQTGWQPGSEEIAIYEKDRAALEREVAKNPALAEYRASLMPRATPVPRPRAITPRPTPSAAEVNAEILRKYGSRP